jgi:signal peptidase I
LDNRYILFKISLPGMRQFLLVIWETIQVAVISLAVVLVVRNFIIQPFFVDGSSMVPNFQDGDYLIIDELTFRFREPQRGEVIVFKFPQNESSYFIKRVIGLPGDTVQVKNGVVNVFNQDNPEGVQLSENYLISKTPGDIQMTLQTGEYFVLGDNRTMSYDSRSWGVLPAKEIVGLVRLRLWPINSAKAITAPQY